MRMPSSSVRRHDVGIVDAQALAGMDDGLVPDALFFASNSGRHAKACADGDQEVPRLDGVERFAARHAMGPSGGRSFRRDDKG